MHPNTIPPQERFWRQLGIVALVIIPMKLSANWSREPRPALVPDSVLTKTVEVVDQLPPLEPGQVLQPDHLFRQGTEQLHKARQAAEKMLKPAR